MPPLKNVKHEKFVRAVVSSPTYTEAYQKTYNSEYDSARSAAPRLLANDSVKNRLLEVMEEKEMNEEWISKGLKALAENDPKGSVKLGAYRTVLEVRKDIDSASHIGINVNTINHVEYADKLRILSRYASKHTA